MQPASRTPVPLHRGSRAVGYSSLALLLKGLGGASMLVEEAVWRRQRTRPTHGRGAQIRYGLNCRVVELACLSLSSVP